MMLGTRSLLLGGKRPIGFEGGFGFTQAGWAFVDTYPGFVTPWTLPPQGSRDYAYEESFGGFG